MDTAMSIVNESDGESLAFIHDGHSFDGMGKEGLCLKGSPVQQATLVDCTQGACAQDPG